MADVNRMYVQTGLGRMPIKDFLETRAIDAGYKTYTAAYERGFRVKGYENITPDDLYN